MGTLTLAQHRQKVACQGIFNWDLTNDDTTSPEEQMETAAILARLLHHLALGAADYRHRTGDDADQSDDALLVATSATERRM